MENRDMNRVAKIDARQKTNDDAEQRFASNKMFKKWNNKK